MVSSVVTTNTSPVANGYTRMVGYETFDPVLCLTISGKQDIRLKLKQSEQIFGPKVIEKISLDEFSICFANSGRN